MAGLYGNTQANLTKAVAGETYETTSMYPAFAAVAAAEGYASVAERLAEVGSDESAHAAAFQAILMILLTSDDDPTAPTGGMIADSPSLALAGAAMVLVLLGTGVLVTRTRIHRRTITST